MELAWMMLANHAEAAPNGLLYISGGTWDTLNVGEPLPDSAPPGIVAFFQGALVLRIAFEAGEIGEEYRFRISITDDGRSEIGNIEGDLRPTGQKDQPAGWPISANLVVSLTGLPLPRFGEYSIRVGLGDRDLGELPFRVLQRY
jgi:hypothetical protein